VFVGPVATKQSYEDYQRYAGLAGDAVRAGGKVIKDGAMAHGYFVRPTVLAGLPPDHQLAARRAVRPDRRRRRVDSLDQALARANDTRFG
jgi:acyl-CoA reductase-like NAD-dependent aldehyde dehydrogenase